MEYNASIELRNLEAAEKELTTSDHLLTPQEIVDYFEQRISTNIALIEYYRGKGLEMYEADEESGKSVLSRLGTAVHDNSFVEHMIGKLKESGSLQEFVAMNPPASNGKSGTSLLKEVAQELHNARAHVKNRNNFVETSNLDEAIADLIGNERWVRILQHESENIGTAYIEPEVSFNAGFQKMVSSESSI